MNPNNLNNNMNNFNNNNFMNMNNMNNMQNEGNINLNKIIQNQANEINKLKEENEKLKADLNRANKIISDMQNNQLNNNELNNLRDEIKKLQHQLTTKENEIKDFKNKFQNNIKNNTKVYWGDIMVINFSSAEINCGIKCLPTDIFAEVEEKLYQRCDVLRNTNNMFIANAKPVLRFKKIYENNIKDGDVLQLHKIE